jgi:hypothetical protein
VIWLLEAATAARAGAVIEKRLEIPAAIRGIARSFIVLHTKMRS